MKTHNQNSTRQNYRFGRRAIAALSTLTLGVGGAVAVPPTDGLGVQLGAPSFASAQTGSDTQIPYIEAGKGYAIGDSKKWLVTFPLLENTNGNLETIVLSSDAGEFVSGQYTVSSDGHSETVEGKAYKKNGKSYVELNLQQSFSVAANKDIQVRFNGDGSNFPEKRNYDARFILSPTVPNYPELNLTNVQGDPDPNTVLEGERCNAEGGLAGKVTTWIAESYYPENLSLIHI